MLEGGGPQQDGHRNGEPQDEVACLADISPFLRKTLCDMKKPKNPLNTWTTVTSPTVAIREGENSRAHQLDCRARVAYPPASSTPVTSSAPAAGIHDEQRVCEF